MPRLTAATLLLVAGLWPPGPAAAQRGPTGEPPPPTGAPDAAPAEDGEEDEAEDGEEDEDMPLPGDEDLEPYSPATEPPAAARTPRTICHGRRVRRIEVQEARRVDEDDIRTTLGLRPGATCTDMEVTRGTRALWDLGFFDDIVIEAEMVDADEVDLTITVTERPAVGKIVYEGNDELGKDKITEKVTLKEGEILSVPDIARQVSKIRELYSKEGYFLARVRYELHKMPTDRNEVEVRFLIDEGDEVTVRRIRFVGNKALSQGELTGVMQTGETGLFSFITSSNRFDREAFEEDMIRVQAYYYDQGYLEMQTGTPRVELTADRQHIDITIPVEEGNRFKIGEMRVTEVDDEGREVEPLGGRGRLEKMLTQKPGDWFSRSKIGETLEAITRFYRDRGYAKAEVLPETHLRDDDRVVDVRVAIRRGPLVRIERINIRGNAKTRDAVLRREVEIAETEIYNQTSIERSRERMQRLGYFETVSVSEEEGSQPDRIVLNFEVTEQATGTFQVGAGFSSIESFILTAQIQQQNLFGRGQSLSLQLQLSGIRQLAMVQFIEPYLFGTEWSLMVDAFKTIRQFPDFVRDSTGGGFSLGHPIKDNRLRLFLRYRGEYVNIQARTGGLFGLTGRGRAFAAINPPPLANLFLDGFTSSFTLSLTWDSRNNRMFPTDGWFASASAEVADPYTGSQNTFTRYQAFTRFYKQIWGPFVLKMNAEIGLITSRDDRGVPIFERYFLGGIFNVRGFFLNSLGPRVGIPRATDPNAGAPQAGIAVGGNLQAFYNIELEFPLIDAVGIRGVIFTDGGNAWNLEQTLCQAPAPPLQNRYTDPCSVNPLAIRTSVGFGFRWLSPLGPLRFEWGIPLNRQPGENPIQFEFTIGNFF
jgi:outer membrane protein insertion porin family